ncbi:hypothetical protein [Anabaena sp. CCY 9402-a]
MGDRSNITATAGSLGDGGNININAPIITGLENSDITAFPAVMRYSSSN